MASEQETQQETQSPPDPVAQAQAEARAAHERLAALEAEKVRLAAENQTYRQVLETVQQPKAPTADLGFDAALVNAYRQRGFTDEQIRANLDILAPVLDYAGNQIGRVMQAQQTELQRLRAATDRGKYKDWDILAPYVEQEQQRAMQQGRALDVDTAYAIAFTNHYDKVQAARATQDQASAAARDATATNRVQSARTQVVREDAPLPTTAADLRQLPPAERAKVWDALADKTF